MKTDHIKMRQTSKSKATFIETGLKYPDLRLVNGDDKLRAAIRATWTAFLNGVVICFVYKCCRRYLKQEIH